MTTPNLTPGEAFAVLMWLDAWDAIDDPAIRVERAHRARRGDVVDLAPDEWAVLPDWTPPSAPAVALPAASQMGAV